MRLDLNNPPADLRNPANSEITYIDVELASRCDGARCGLTCEDGEEPPPIQPTHFHIRARGELPLAGPWYYAIGLEDANH